MRVASKEITQNPVNPRQAEENTCRPPLESESQHFGRIEREREVEGVHMESRVPLGTAAADRVPEADVD